MLSKTQLTAVVGALATFSTALPASSSGDSKVEGPWNCGSTCQSRKAQLTKLGAGAFELAVAVLEHGDKMQSDPSQNSADSNNIGGQGDGANFSMFNLNWYMIRSKCSGFTQYGPNDWAQGAKLNNNDAGALQCLKEARSGFGDQWYAVQRSGQSMCNPDSIKLYTTGVNTIQSYMQSHLSDDMVESYDVYYQGHC